jgi:hypothetical protein
MKTIQPINIWVNGKTDIAIIFSLNCVFDNLTNSANFYYQLININSLKIADGNLIMEEPDYTTDWTTNNAAYLWAATQLNLVITGDYVPV